MNSPDQQPPLGDRIPENARLLSRLGEAAKGVEVQPYFYLVASADPLARVFVYTELPAAQQKRNELGDAYGAYGPFEPRRRHVLAPRPVSVTIEYEGDAESMTIDVGGAAGIDAVFLSAAALDKFVYPYYANFLEPDELKALQDDLERTRAWLHDVTTTIEGRR